MKEKFLLIFGVLLGATLLLGSLTWLNMQLVQRVDMNVGEQFIAPWTSARAFLFEGEHPYLPSVAQKAQVAVYGRYAQEGEYPYQLNIPFYKLFLYFPFAFFSNFELALSVWMSVAELALLGVGYLSIHLSGWKPSVLNAVLFYLVVIFSFYGVYPVLGGSGTVFTAFIFLLILLAIREGRDGLIGILLIFSSFFPARGGLLLGLILFWVFITRQGYVFSVVAMSLSVLFVISFLILPDWFLAYYQSLTASFGVEYGFLFSDFLKIWLPETGDTIAQIIRWLTVILISIEGYNLFRRREFDHLLWTVALGIVIVPFFNIYISPYFYTIFLFPLPLLFKSIQSRWRKSAGWFIPFFLLLILFVWFIFITVENALQLLAFLYPAILLVGLYWVRWWSLRAPHTWLDEVDSLVYNTKG